MRIHVQLSAQTPDSSLSVLTIAGEFVCFVLEDGYSAEKVYAQTRIPPGVYQVARRTEGGFYAQYKRKYGHEFSIQIANVPNFEHILIHIGNTIGDTAGCLLVGYGVDFNGRFSVTRSTAAYLYLYNLVKAAFDRGENVEVEISREILQAAAPKTA